MTCEVKENCFGNESDCWRCKFSDGSNVDNCYRAINKNIKHPQALAAKLAAKAITKAERHHKKLNKDKAKSKVVRASAKVEDKVKTTLNSGRINRDGDLKTEHLAIDVKMQSSRINPQINAEEFRKIQNDAARSGKEYGVLIIESKIGERFVVIPEDLFKEKFV